MRLTYFSGALTAAITFAMMSCSHNQAVHGDAHEDQHAAEAEEHGHGADEIILKPEAAEKFGVEVSRIEPVPFSEVIKVSGEILPATDDVVSIVAKSSGIVHISPDIVSGKQVNAGTRIASISAKGVSGGDINAATAADVAAAKRELDRLKPLYDERIITKKEYNAALTTYEKAVAMHSGNNSGSVAVSPISGVITSMNVAQGGFVNTGDVIATVAKNARLTLRADLPQKYARLLPGITGANFSTSYMDTIVSLDKMNGHRLSSATASVTPGYVPVYFVFDNDGSIIPGSYAEVYLISAEKKDVLSVPVSALTEQQGKHFVYVRVDDHGYEKRPVVLGNNDGMNVEIISGVNPGDNVVVKGAVFVKLAETSNVVPEGHSHNH